MTETRLNSLKAPSDPAIANEFDEALRLVHGKYTAGEPLTISDLRRLVNATLPLMKGAGR